MRICGRTLWEKPNSHDVHASACELSCCLSVLHSSHICKWRTSFEELFRGPSRRMLHPQSNHGCLLRYWQRPHKVTEDNRGTNFGLQGTWPWHVVLPSVGSVFYRVSKINTYIEDILNMKCTEWRICEMSPCGSCLAFLSPCRHRSLSSIEANVFFPQLFVTNVSNVSREERTSIKTCQSY